MKSKSMGKLFVVSAPSGAGKTTLVTEVIRRMGEFCPIARVVTYTTKPARPGEDRHGIDYHYLTPHEFQAKIAQGFFLEWSGTYGNYYGSPRSVLDDLLQGFSRILILDRAGAQNVKRCYEPAVLIWIYTKSIGVLQERLSGRSRGADAADQIARRLALAREEVEQEMRARLYEHHVLNDCFQSALQEFEGVIKKELFGPQGPDQKDFVQKNLQGL
jgi:guanylate kinase